MTAREYLRSYRAYERRLKQLYDKQAKQRIHDYGIGSMDYAKDRVQTSPTSGAIFEDEVIKALDKQAEIERDIGCVLENMETIRCRILAISNKQYRSILVMRYIGGMSLLQIASEIDYSIDYTKKVSAEAVKAFAVKYDYDE